ncbi:MAG: Rrf2 family transcriptional regulator [Pirellulaceae bacterium]|nr:Rrf2 family transcriptional regulator [Pirellulaceae bacterium]
MKLSLQTDYALRTLIYAAYRNERITIADVAEFYGISRPHVAKVVNLLSKHGFLRSIRGIGGGVEIARPVDGISVGEVIQCSEGKTHLLDCVSQKNICVIEQFCKLKSVLAEAERIQLDFLMNQSIADMLPRRREIVQLQTVASE